MNISIFGTILIDAKKDKCFYHVLGDETEFYDLYSLVSSHPEQSAFVELNRHELERGLLKQKEIMGINDKY